VILHVLDKRPRNLLVRPRPRSLNNNRLGHFAGPRIRDSDDCDIRNSRVRKEMSFQLGGRDL
jgi:hypothetical protein